MIFPEYGTPDQLQERVLSYEGALLIIREWLEGRLPDATDQDLVDMINQELVRENDPATYDAPLL